MRREPRIARTAVAVALVLMGASALFTLPARAATSLPVWTAGDYWTYNLTGSSFSGLGGSGTYRVDVVRTESLSANGTTYTTYHTKLNVTVTQTSGSTTTTITILGDEWYRTSDFALVRRSFSFSLGLISLSTTQTNNPPPGFQWPLTPGATWTDTYVATQVVVLGSVTETTYVGFVSTLTVQADTTVIVPAGTFDATPLKESAPSGINNITYWSSAAGSWVRQTSDVFGTVRTDIQLMSYRYQGGGGALGILGLSTFIWILIVLVLVAIVAAVVLVMRRRPRLPQPMPPMQPPMEPGAIPPAPPMIPGPPQPPPGSAP